MVFGASIELIKKIIVKIDMEIKENENKNIIMENDIF